MDTQKQDYAASRGEVLAALESGREVITRLQSMGWTLKAGRRGQLVPMQVAALAGSLASPADCWARAAVGTLDGLNIEDQATLVASSIKVAAAKLKAGDLDPAREALIGQAGWLGALAVRLEALAAEVPSEHGAAQEREGLIKLALRAADAAGKAMASAAALNAIKGYQDVTGG